MMIGFYCNLLVRIPPSAACDCEGLGECVVVNDAGMHGEEAHQQNDVATAEEHAEDLEERRNWLIIIY
jgi:hypothetical protein